MGDARVFGNNITWLLNNKNIKIEEFASALGYSDAEARKLCEARLFVTQDDVEDIAQYFQVPKEELYTDKGEQEYQGAGFIHFMGEFKHSDNKKKILDILDMYCDVREVLSI